MFQFLERQVALSNPLSAGEMDAPASKMESEALSITLVSASGRSLRSLFPRPKH